MGLQLAGLYSGLPGLISSLHRHRRYGRYGRYRRYGRNHLLPRHLIDEALDIAIREADTLPHSGPSRCLLHNGVFVLRVGQWAEDEQRAVLQLQLRLGLTPHMEKLKPTSGAERRRQHTAVTDKVAVLIVTTHKQRDGGLERPQPATSSAWGLYV
jgi:hypothetical protein